MIGVLCFGGGLVLAGLILGYTTMSATAALYDARAARSRR